MNRNGQVIAQGTPAEVFAGHGRNWRRGRLAAHDLPPDAVHLHSPLPGERSPAAPLTLDEVEAALRAMLAGNRKAAGRAVARRNLRPP